MKVFKPTLATLYASRKAEFDRWESEISIKLKNRSASEGPLYLGDKVPFPYNPSFRPPPVLSTATRNHIFATWESDKTKWTPRALSATFKVSIERIGAIIRQKCLEKQVSTSKAGEGNGRLFHVYATKMDQILGAGRRTEAPIAEGDLSTSSRLPPKLIAIPENSRMSSEEAASLLEKKLYIRKDLIEKEIESMRPFFLDPSAGKKQSAPEKADEPVRIISKDQEEASRWKYFIHDVGNKSNGLLVREPNGTLRYASTAEIMKEETSMKSRSRSL